MCTQEVLLIYGNTASGKSTLGRLLELGVRLPYYSFGELLRRFKSEGGSFLHNLF